MDKLPTEVLAEIVELLRDDRRDLLSVSHTNKKLHAIANDIIYSHYELYYHETSLFIRALASNPNLQRCVQHIKWNSPIHDEGAFEFPRWPTEAEFDQIKEKVGFPFPAAWPRHSTFLTGKLVEVNNWMRLRTESDLYLSTFMLFTPNVKELFISTKQWEEAGGMWFVQSLVGKIGTNLQKVVLDGGANAVNLLPLFLLPNMKTLLIDYLLETPLHEDAELEAINLVWARLEKEGSNLEHLKISHTTTDMLDLARLVKSLKNLKVLDYKFGCGDGSAKKTNRAVQTLLEAIGNHCASVNNMAIDDDRLVMNPGALEQLRGLENVETFQMPTPVFYEKLNCRSVTKEFLAESLQRNLGNLPKHLKNLRISTKTGYHDVTETCFDVLLTLGPAIKTLLPDLETITFFGWHPQLGTFPCQTRIAALQSAFAQVGVKIVSEHDTVGDSERWYTKTRVGASSKIEEDYVWVHLLEDFEGERENPWVARFGSSYRGDELNGDVWDSDEEEEGGDDDEEEVDGDEDGDDDNGDGEDSNGDEWEDEEDDDETPNPSAGGRPLNMQDIMEEMGILAAQGRMPGMPGMQPTNDDNEEDGDDGEEDSNTEFGPGRPLTMQDIENEMRIMMGQGLIFNLPGMPGYRPGGEDEENSDDEEEGEEGSNDSDAEQDEDDSENNNDNDNDNDPPPAIEPLPSASHLTLQEIEEKMQTMMAQERMFKLPGMPHFNPEDQYDSEEEEEEEEEEEDDDDDDGFNYRWTV